MSRPPAASDATAAIPVVAAVIVRDDRLLLCQRPEGPHLPLLWEFPGGKIDAGETPAEALVRELREELGVAARVGSLLHEVVHEYPEKRVWIRFYATSIEGDPIPIVHRSLRWVEIDALRSYDAPPPNAQVIRLIHQRVLRVSGGELEFH